MLELRGGGDLLHEAVGAQDGGQLGLEDLDGHLAVVLEVLGQVDRGHPALAQLPLDAVAVRQGGGQAIGSLAHEPPFASSFAGQFWTSTASVAEAVCRTMNRWPSGLTA